MRRPDALEALVELGDDVAGQPFQWGATDCVALGLRALACVAVDGAPYLEHVHWHSFRQAVAAFRDDQVQAWLSGMLAEGELEEVPVDQVQAGDVIVGRALAGDVYDELELVDDTRAAWPTVYVQIGSRMVTSDLRAGVSWLSRDQVVDLARLRGWRAFRVSV